MCELKLNDLGRDLKTALQVSEAMSILIRFSFENTFWLSVHTETVFLVKEN